MWVSQLSASHARITSPLTLCVFSNGIRSRPPCSGGSVGIGINTITVDPQCTLANLAFFFSFLSVSLFSFAAFTACASARSVCRHSVLSNHSMML